MKATYLIVICAGLGVSACAPVNHGHVDSSGEFTSRTVDYTQQYGATPAAPVETVAASARYYGRVVRESAPYTLNPVPVAPVYSAPPRPAPARQVIAVSAPYRLAPQTQVRSYRYTPAPAPVPAYAPTPVRRGNCPC